MRWRAISHRLAHILPLHPRQIRTFDDAINIKLAQTGIGDERQNNIYRTQDGQVTGLIGTIPTEADPLAVLAVGTDSFAVVDQKQKVRVYSCGI